MDGPSRRTVLGALAAGAATTLAGCSVSVGTMDLTVQNCLPDPRVVAVTVTAESTGEVLYDDRHDVPGETCSDVQEAPVAVSDVVSSAGRYRVRGESPQLEAVEEIREFEEAVVRNDDDSINVYVEEDGLSVN
jgi:D-alanine-D-alanine ligase-like ATP-grasp enzyme